MSQKHRKFSPEFKTKVVLELLQGDITVNGLASKYNILPKSIQQWKKQFLDNASLAFENAVPVKKYRDEIKEKESQIDALSKALGQTTIERDWLSKKLRSLDRNKRKSLVESKLNNISITRRCELLNINRTTLYYHKKGRPLSEFDLKIMNVIDEIYTDHPCYGYRRMYYELKEKGYSIGKRKIVRFMKLLNIKALCTKKRKIFTSMPDNSNKTYPYLLKNIDIEKPNLVWVSDISYIRLNRGFSYLCAVMDLKTRAVLSHRLSATMDDSLVTDTIEKALRKYGSPEIFNSDQGSQYTSNKTINLLKGHNISISMDAKGRCFDNIFMERFWRTLKQENVYPSGYESLKDARAGISNYIKRYNWERLHSSIGYKAPMKVYIQNQNIQDAA